MCTISRRRKDKSHMKTQNVLATVRSVEKNRDFPAMLRILDEECRKCTPITPFECISSCKTWKLKNELRRLHKTIENPDFMKDLMNVLKNDTRLHILMTIAKSPYFSARARDPPPSTISEIITSLYLKKVLNPNGFRDLQPHHKSLIPL